MQNLLANTSDIKPYPHFGTTTPSFNFNNSTQSNPANVDIVNITIHQHINQASSKSQLQTHYNVCNINHRNSTKEQHDVRMKLGFKIRSLWKCGCVTLGFG